MLAWIFYLAITVSELWPFENLKKLRNFQKLTKLWNDDVYVNIEVDMYYVKCTWSRKMNLEAKEGLI